MLNQRTRRGTPIRSTLGMRTLKNHHTWILVADRHRLCLFERIQDELGRSLLLREEYLNPEGRMKGHELGSDRPGRSFDSQDRTHHGQKGGVRHSYGSSYSLEDRTIETLVSHAVDFLKKGKFDDTETSLTVLAEPSLMGILRPSLQRAAPRCEMSFKNKDFSWLAGDELEERLNAILQ